MIYNIKIIGFYGNSIYSSRSFSTFIKKKKNNIMLSKFIIIKYLTKILPPYFDTKFHLIFILTIVPFNNKFYKKHEIGNKFYEKL